ncbi:MAG: hypothetical protein LBK61_11910 [Spirochaetaceae bacterium]|jgi:hypothetical protein|nr:hypothetical protein [Spirochaetaceae bacterium]
MKKGKKFFVEAVALLLGASLFFVGCETEGETENDGGEGSGPAAAEPLAGDQTTAEIVKYLNGEGPYVFAGVVQQDAGTVYIPAGKSVALAGETAYTVAANGVLIIGDDAAVTGGGKLKCGSSGRIIATKTIKENNVDTNSQNRAVVIPDPASSESIDVSPAIIVVKSDNGVTINEGDTTSTNIKNDALGTKTLYVIGNLTVSAVIDSSPAPSEITVTGNVTVSEDQTAAVPWHIAGNLTATKKPTAETGSLDVQGNATFEEAVSGITGAIKIGGNAEFTETVTAGTGTISIGGNATFTKAFTAGAGAISIGGDATFTETVTAGNGTISIGGKATFAKPFTIADATKLTLDGDVEFKDTFTRTDGALTFGGDVTLTDSKSYTFKSTATITLKAGKSINGVFVAGDDADVVLTPGTGEEGTVLNYGNNGITLNASGNDLALTSGELTIPGGKTFQTQNEFKVEGALTVKGTLSVVSGNLGGKLNVADGGNVLLVDAGSKVELSSEGALTVNENGTFGADPLTNTKITVTKGNTTPTLAESLKDESDPIWTITSESGQGGSNGNDFTTSDNTPLLGKLKIAVDGRNAVGGIACSAAETGATGTLKTPGSNTSVFFSGTN